MLKANNYVTWEKLKNTLYHEDGSLRDIYIRDTNTADWKRWIDCINTHYPVDFYIAGEKISNQIDFETAVNFWQNPPQDLLSAIIYVEKIVVNVLFFSETEIEIDITPEEIKSLNDHENLVDFLKTVSQYVCKPVELTEENCQMPEEVLMVIDGEQVFFTKQLS